MDSANLHRRLAKIIGQIQAIDRMVDEDIPCEDILAQINAAKSALNKAGKVVPNYGWDKLHLISICCQQSNLPDDIFKSFPQIVFRTNYCKWLYLRVHSKELMVLPLQKK